MNEKLIVDAGFHKGEDADFYLKQGYDVVAVEASRELMEAGKIQFQEYVGRDQFKILNYVIGKESGKEIEFYIGNTTVWNSTNSHVTNRDNGVSRTEMVESITLLDVFKQHGVPFYCKIDLEGMDATAIRSLEDGFLPAFISCESECYGWDESNTPEESLDTLNALKEKGYNRFKIIDQKELSELNTKKNFYKKDNFLSYRIKKWSRLFLFKILRYPILQRHAYELKFKYRFPMGSSGPGPIDEDFRKNGWMDYEKTREIILFYREQKLKVDNKNLWVDIHATF